MINHLLIILLITIHTGLSDKDANKRTKCRTQENPDHQNSFLWTLNRDPPSYFFGTIHVPYTKVWNHIPESTKEAFQQSENIFFELDLTDVYTVTALANCQLLPNGENLSDVLPVDMFNRLKSHLEYVRQKMPSWMSADQKGRGMYADYLFNAIAGNWQRKRPIWVMLMVNSLTESDIKSRGTPVLDLYLAQQAEKIGKVTGAIERVEEQCVPLNELNFSQVLFALNQTLWQHEAYRASEEGGTRYTTDELIYHYNCGDLNAVILNQNTAQVRSLVNNSLPPGAQETAKLIDEYFRLELINKRNERMAERVISLLKAHPNKSFFFAFGAGHFLGNNTILDRLWEEGYKVEHTPPDSIIPKHRNSNKHHGKNHRKKGKNTSFPNYDSFSDFWFQLESDTDYSDWLKKRDKHRKKIYNRYKEKPFNDLWVKMDAETSDLMNQLAERYMSSKGVTQEQTVSEDRHGYSHSNKLLPWQPSWLWTFLLVLNVIQYLVHSC